jgi:hypothetical protein
VFFTFTLCTCHTHPVAQRATAQQLHTNGIFLVVPFLLLMVALQILVPQSVKSRSIKRPYVRGAQTLVTFFCSSSFCLGTIPPLCHSSAPKLIKCNTLYVHESKELKVLSIIRQYLGPWQHIMILWAISKPGGCG